MVRLGLDDTRGALVVESGPNRVVAAAIHSRRVESMTEWNRMMAFAVLANAPLAVASILLQRYRVRGMTVGAIA